MPGQIKSKNSIEEIADQAANRDADDIKRQTLRGDESKGDPDERDSAGGPAHQDTEHGREEAKIDKKGKANTNG